MKYIADLALLHAEHARKYAIKSHDKKSEWILDGRIAVCLGNSREKEKADSAYRAYMCKPILDTVIFARNLFNYSQILVGRYPTEPDKAISYFLSAKNGPLLLHRNRNKKLRFSRKFRKPDQLTVLLRLFLLHAP
ncbi:MAG: hypothetical protein IJ151_03610 [Bacteroidales bacterium]|nr:hypothetical protein [Bacteroidales bacterium]